jgi:hypothetical protein
MESSLLSFVAIIVRDGSQCKRGLRFRLGGSIRKEHV